MQRKLNNNLISHYGVINSVVAFFMKEGEKLDN